MAEDWAGIASEVLEAIASVGFAATLEQPNLEGPEYDPVQGEPTLHAVTVIDDQTRKRDTSGTVTGSTRTLTVGSGVVPQKGWRVLVRGQWHRIAEVSTLAPGGVDLLYDLTLEG